MRELLSRRVLAGMLAILVLPIDAANAGETSVSPPGRGGRPVTIEFLMYMVDLNDINGPEQTFNSNIYIQLSWKDDRLINDDHVLRSVPLKDIWQPNLLVVNQADRINTSFPEVAKVRSDGMVTYRQRYIGKMSQPLFLSEFPFDSHKFSVQFASAGHSVEDIAFVPGKVPGSKNKLGGILAKNLSLPDWTITGYTVAPRSLHLPGTDREVAGFAFEFTAARDVTYFFWNLMLPLILIVMMSWIAFWIDATDTNTQVSLAAGSMLTLVAYRFVLANLVPRLSYLTRLDWFTLLSTLLVFMALVEVAVTSRLAYNGNINRAQCIDRWARVGFPGVFAIVVVWSFV